MSPSYSVCVFACECVCVCARSLSLQYQSLLLDFRALLSASPLLVMPWNGFSPDHYPNQCATLLPQPSLSEKGSVFKCVCVCVCAHLRRKREWQRERERVYMSVSTVAPLERERLCMVRERWILYTCWYRCAHLTLCVCVCVCLRVCVCVSLCVCMLSRHCVCPALYSRHCCKCLPSTNISHLSFSFFHTLAYSCRHKINSGIFKLQLGWLYGLCYIFQLWLSFCWALCTLLLKSLGSPQRFSLNQENSDLSSSNELTDQYCTNQPLEHRNDVRCSS